MLTSMEQRFELPQIGHVVWIGVRPARREALQVLDGVSAVPGSGLVGDRYRGSAGKREVTLLQAEHLPVIASLLNRTEPIAPGLLRRNLLVAGINLLGLQRRRFRIGDAVLEVTGLAHPCSRMEEALGPGGWNAMRGHGGITARVVTAGVIRLGAEVRIEA